MKNYFLGLLGLVATGLATSCSSDGIITDDDNTVSDGTPRHLTVNVMNSANTRAEFEDGTAEENVVFKVRFYFFDASGNKAAVKKNGDAYLDWTTDPESDLTNGAESSTETVEATSVAHLIINTSVGDHLPARIVAICNPDKVAGLSTSYATSDDLKKVLLNDTKHTKAATEVATYANGDFIMSNSSYADRTIAGEPYDLVRFGTEIAPANICLTEDEANSNPVNIYVERVVARVEGGINNTKLTKDGDWTDGASTYPVYQCKKVTEPINFNGTSPAEPLYVALVGWNVSGVATKSTLGKIIGTWASDLWSTDGNWNNASLHRSYWEQNNYTIVKPTVKPYNGSAPTATQMSLGYGTYNDAKLNNFSSKVYIYPNAATKDNEATHKYNTSDYSYGDPAAAAPLYYDGYTEVIVAAVLLKKNGTNDYTPIEIANWLGNDYTVANLKTAYLSYIQSDYNVKIVDNSIVPATTTIRQLLATDLDFATIDGQSIGAGTGIDQYETRRYAVYPQTSATLNAALDATGAVTTTIVKASDNSVTYTKAEFNAALKSLETAKIWTGGQTYYHFPLQHLAPSAGDQGKWGVVRNHIYRFSIEDIQGLGTPVYNPTEVIIPEDVDPQYSYISAKINILQWRVVPQSVTLGK